MHALHLPSAFHFLPVFLAMVLLEWVVSRIQGRQLYTRANTLATLGVDIGQFVYSFLSFFVILQFNLFLWKFRLLELPMGAWWYWFALFVGVEFFYYWQHRLSHEIRWLWATHSVHHSTEELNILAAYRIGWTGVISMGFLVYAPLVLLGFHPVSLLLMIAFNVRYQLWLHTILIGQLGFLEGILNTPSAHRVHHARNADYLDRNYGAVTVIFDRLFGTYVPERVEDPCDFGLVKPVNSHNPFVIAFHEWWRMICDLRAKPIKHWPGLLFGPPGWAPYGQGCTSKQLREKWRSTNSP